MPADHQAIIDFCVTGWDYFPACACDRATTVYVGITTLLLINTIAETIWYINLTEKSIYSLLVSAGPWKCCLLCEQYFCRSSLQQRFVVLHHCAKGSASLVKCRVGRCLYMWYTVCLISCFLISANTCC